MTDPSLSHAEFEDDNDTLSFLDDEADATSTEETTPPVNFDQDTVAEFFAKKRQRPATQESVASESVTPGSTPAAEAERPGTTFGGASNVVLPDTTTSSVNDSATLEMMNRRERRARRQKIGAGVAGAVLVGALGLGLAGVNPFHSNVPSGQNNTQGKANGNDSSKGVTKSTAVDTSFLADAGDWPGRGPAWESKVRTQLSPYDMKSMRELGATHGLGTVGASLPSKDAGWTSDPKSYLMPDGTPNTRYTYMTGEDAQNIINLDIERFINPNVGAWNYLLHSRPDKTVTVNGAEWDDMFTARYLADPAHKEPRDRYPLLADWDNNDYGMGDKLLPAGSPRWMGRLTSSDVTKTYDRKTLSYTYVVDAKITYHAWSVDQEELTKNATMKLTFVTNQNKNADSGHKMLIDAVDYKVG